jgi:hypothetical protein
MLTKLPCFACGAKPAGRYRHSLKNDYYKQPYIHSGLDRLSNRHGYTNENSAPCCAKCNYAKGVLTLEQFLIHVYKVYNHSIREAVNAGQRSNEDY